jgi:hypothetical protein
MKTMTVRMSATPLTALLTGAWTVSGMSFGGWLEAAFPPSPIWHNVLFACNALAFFFIPCFIFVVGEDISEMRSNTPFSNRYWSAMRRIAFRMLCWLLGGALVGAIFSAMSFFKAG